MINNNNKRAVNLPFPDIYRSPHIHPTHKWGRRWMGGGEILKEIMMMLMMMMTDDLFDDTYGDYDDNHDVYIYAFWDLPSRRGLGGR